MATMLWSCIFDFCILHLTFLHSPFITLIFLSYTHSAYTRPEVRSSYAHPRQEWLAVQQWSNGSIVTTGISYLAHVQTAMAVYRPPSLKAMYIDKVCTCACVLALHHNREAHPYNTRAHVFQTSIKRSTDAPFSRIGRP